MSRRTDGPIHTDAPCPPPVGSFRISDAAAPLPISAGQARDRRAEDDRLFELSFSIYRSLLTCSETRDRLTDGEEPGDVHLELARRSLLAARIFWAEARRELDRGTISANPGARRRAASSEAQAASHLGLTTLRSQTTGVDRP